MQQAALTDIFSNLDRASPTSTEVLRARTGALICRVSEAGHCPQQRTEGSADPNPPFLHRVLLPKAEPVHAPHLSPGLW